MGCVGSAPAPTTAPKSPRSSGRRQSGTRIETAEDRKNKRARDEQRVAEAEMYARKESLRLRALPMIETQQNYDAGIPPLLSESDLILNKMVREQARRKLTKLKAEEEQRWVVRALSIFNSPI